MRVLGDRERIPELVERLRVDQVLLAIPTVTSEVVREIVALCERAGVGIRVLPSIREVIGHRVTVRDIRDLRIEDLLGRQVVQTDLEAVRGILAGRRVLVTGAGGSIGRRSSAGSCRSIRPAWCSSTATRSTSTTCSRSSTTTNAPSRPWRTSGSGSSWWSSSASIAPRWCSTRRRTSTSDPGDASA